MGEQRDRLDAFNSASAAGHAARAHTLSNVLGEVGRGAVVMPRFQCSYGYSIRLGEDSFVNANAFFMDDAPITIDAGTRIGPGAQLMTALHPVDDHQRWRDGWERAAAITIEDNVWLGAPSRGSRRSYRPELGGGAGSVVLSDVPDHVVAAGTPATVIGRIGNEDNLTDVSQVGSAPD